MKNSSCARPKFFSSTSPSPSIPQPRFPEKFFSPEFSSEKGTLFPNGWNSILGFFEWESWGKWNEKSELNIVFAVEKGSDHAPVSVSSRYIASEPEVPLPNIIWVIWDIVPELDEFNIGVFEWEPWGSGMKCLPELNIVYAVEKASDHAPVSVSSRYRIGTSKFPIHIATSR
ncbi:hypothetical protein CEXT_791471 [Caerostris extrusa]|uniref:Uncharacterized protein n=1 Tax=Caerostris extrusa TaxID=172846 RepID=A0AAV4XAB1_CAEEX|nr:hypothetical protein CEXT_791471 [Caerostris extrusa]